MLQSSSHLKTTVLWNCPSQVKLLWNGRCQPSLRAMSQLLNSLGGLTNHFWPKFLHFCQIFREFQGPKNTPKTILPPTMFQGTKTHILMGQGRSPLFKGVNTTFFPRRPRVLHFFPSFFTFLWGPSHPTPSLSPRHLEQRCSGPRCRGGEDPLAFAADEGHSHAQLGAVAAAGEGGRGVSLHRPAADPWDAGKDLSWVSWL